MKEDRHDAYNQSAKMMNQKKYLIALRCPSNLG